MSRSELREVIVKVLYQTYIYEEKNISFEIDDLIKEFLDSKSDFVDNMIKYVKDNQDDIDALANKYMKDWKIDRLSKVDRAILSLAICELNNEETPNIVAINEAIELSKKYSDEKVTKMINGVLDKIMHNEVGHE